MSERLIADGWSEGLPVVPPTEDRVGRILEAVPRDPDEIVGFIPPRGGAATVKKLAANAVMAGCEPAHFPAVLAATEGVVRDDFNLAAVQNLPHVACVVIVIHGPLRRAVGVNAGPNLFGTGVRSNTTIARALGLVLLNLGFGRPSGARPRWGRTVYCFGEDEGGSPWPPFHVTRGVAASQGAVTVFAGESPHCVPNFSGQRASDVLASVAEVLAACGNSTTGIPGEALVVLSGEHAHVVASGGFGRSEVQRHLFDRARKPLQFLKAGGLYGDRFERYSALRLPDGGYQADLPPASMPAGIHVVVAGGRSGKFSAVIPGWGYIGSRALTIPTD